MTTLKSLQLSSIFGLCFLLLASCSQDEIPVPEADLTLALDQAVVLTQTLDLNPSGVAPLSALLSFTTSQKVSTRLRVKGKNNPASDLIKDFSEDATTHAIPILGLYANHNNTIEVTLFDTSGTSMGTARFNIQTPPLTAGLPFISVQSNSENKAPGMTLVSYFGHSGQTGPQQPFIFDEFGDIRWYLDFTDDPVLSGLFYDDGIKRLNNGNYFFGDRSSGRIYEMDLLGQIVNSWTLTGYSFHHEVYEKPNGNFLVTVNNNRIATVEDHILEIDRKSGEIVNVWDLRASLQQRRKTWTSDPLDWVHVNAITYDHTDNSIIVSGRNQGTIKLNNRNEVVWILAPHQDWARADNGSDLTSKLLQPLHANGQPIADQKVLDGTINASDFEWAWYQHAPEVTPNGNLLLFDNGYGRNYENTEHYSRAVAYKIDQVNMTIRQVWQYGAQRGRETFSPIASDVDYDPESNHIFFSPGAIANSGTYGKVIEVDYATGQVLYEATIEAPVAPYGITFQRTERLGLYPD